MIDQKLLSDLKQAAQKQSPSRWNWVGEPITIANTPNMWPWDKYDAEYMRLVSPKNILAMIELIERGHK